MYAQVISNEGKDTLFLFFCFIVILSVLNVCRIRFRFCGWCADDDLHFQFILSQYTHDVPNHRVLCTDMLQRLFPNKTRHELVSTLAWFVKEKEKHY